MKTLLVNWRCPPSQHAIVTAHKYQPKLTHLPLLLQPDECASNCFHSDHGFLHSSSDCPPPPLFNVSSSKTVESHNRKTSSCVSVEKKNCGEVTDLNEQCSIVNTLWSGQITIIPKPKLRVFYFWWIRLLNHRLGRSKPLWHSIILVGSIGILIVAYHNPYIRG